MTSTLAEDSMLDPEISPQGAAKTTRLREASSVLVTGATGFLGAFLLDQLLRATGKDTRFFCLVRERNTAQKKSSNRVLRTLESYGLEGRFAGDRINHVVGDISQPRMGMDEDQYERLAEGVDLIFHCAASVNYTYPYATAKPHTVDGTSEVLRFACIASPVPVQYISSNGVFPGGDDTPYLENDRIDDFLDRMEGGYNQAKWTAERLVWSAVSRGLPVCIFRPGNIGHHSRTGTVNPNDFLSQIIKACACLGYAPLAPEWFFEMTPVDFLVNAIGQMSDDPKHFGNVYNVVQQNPVPGDQVFGRMESRGHITERVPLKEWKSGLRAAAERDDAPELQVLVRTLDSVEPYMADTSVYDISKFTSALSEMGLTMPTVDEEYVTMFLEK